MSVLFEPVGMGAGSSAPAGPQRGCGDYGFLFGHGSTYPWPEDRPEDLPVELFILSMQWETDAPLGSPSDPVALPGPVSLLVESGRLNLSIGEDRDPRERLGVGLPIGGDVGINPGVPFSGFGEQGTKVLAVGIAPVD
jgi:hypothetical protein